MNSIIDVHYLSDSKVLAVLDSVVGTKFIEGDKVL